MLDSVQSNVNPTPWYREAEAHSKHPKAQRVVKYLSEHNVRKAAQTADYGLRRYHCLVDDCAGDLTALTCEDLALLCGVIERTDKRLDRMRVAAIWSDALENAGIILRMDGTIYAIERGGKLHINPSHVQISLLSGKSPPDADDGEPSNSNESQHSLPTPTAPPTPLKNLEESEGATVSRRDKPIGKAVASNTLPCPGVGGKFARDCYEWRSPFCPTCSKCGEIVKAESGGCEGSRRAAPRQRARPCTGYHGRQSPDCREWRHKIPDGNGGAGQFYAACKPCMLAKGQDAPEQNDTPKGDSGMAKTSNSPLHCKVPECMALKAGGTDYCGKHDTGELPPPPARLRHPPVQAAGIVVPHHARVPFLRGLGRDRQARQLALAKTLEQGDVEHGKE